MSGSHHAIPFKYLVRTFIALIFFTVLTVVTSSLDVGHFHNLHIIIAVAIASVKVAIVGMYFMGLNFDKRLNVVIFLGNFLFLFLFIFITVADLKTRSYGDYQDDQLVPFESPVDVANEK